MLPFWQSLLYMAVTWEFQEVKGYRLAVEDLAGSKDTHLQVNFFSNFMQFFGGVTKIIGLCLTFGGTSAKRFDNENSMLCFMDRLV